MNRAATNEPVRHRLYKGDNLEVMRRIYPEFAGKVPFMYIDPPYNTGFSQFRNYKDKFWGYYDRRRHEGWEKFMEERLEMAYRLLSPTGKIFVSIDDHELPHLILLMRRLFGRDNVEVMIWDKVPQGGSAGQGKMKRSKRFRIDHEYIVVGYVNKQWTRFNKPRMLIPVQKEYGNPDNDPRGPWISAELCKSKQKSNPRGKNYYSITTPGGRVITRQWHVSPEEFERLDRDGRIWWGNGRIIPRLKKFVHEPRPVTPSSIIRNISQTEGIRDLERWGLKSLFAHPKPVRLLKYLLEMASSPGDTVMDFFAGSGSLAEAVMEMNHSLGHRRQCILITNDEDQTIDRVLMPRIEKISKAYPGGHWTYYF